MSDQRPATITVWACPRCGYWRNTKDTGVHMDYRGSGPGKRHQLVATTYRLASDEEDKP